MWKCPQDINHNTVYVYTGENKDSLFEGRIGDHIIWCNECKTTLAVDDMSGETDYSGVWGDGEFPTRIPQLAQPQLNLLDPPEGQIPIKNENSFEFFKKRFKSRD